MSTVQAPKVHSPGSRALAKGRIEINVVKTCPTSPAVAARTGRTECRRVVRTLRFPTTREARLYAELALPVDGESTLHFTRYAAFDGWQSHALATRQADGTYTDSYRNPIEF